jgi:bifunctional non-homologous end joining protein LigD
VKIQRRQELAIAGYTPLRNGAAGVGALLLAIREGDAFRFAGKVGTGYTDEVRRELARALEGDRIAKPQVVDAPRLRDARWVKPRLVAEVAFTEWTADGKLRHPSFQGLRDDKRPEACVREEAGPAARSLTAPASPGRARASRRARR